MASQEPLSKELHLRDRIITHLQQAGTDSISGIARAVSEGLERPIHRLTVAGYLSALADAGELRELDRPPSKHYQLAQRRMHLSLHQRVGRLIQGLDLPRGGYAALAAATLSHLLGRPIFRAELRHAGFEDDDGLLVAPVDDLTRRRYREIIIRRARPRIQLPRSDPLYRVADGVVPKRLVDEVTRRLLVEATGADHLALQPVQDQAQVRLDQVVA